MISMEAGFQMKGKKRKKKGGKARLCDSGRSCSNKNEGIPPLSGKPLVIMCKFWWAVKESKLQPAD
jgi:hypothetical protein